MINRHHVRVARRSPNRGPTPGSRPVATGTLEFVPDGDGRNGWTVVINGVPSSHLDLDDPQRLDFEYMRWTGDLLDVLAPEGEALRVAHIGGAGCTLPRYVAATRPTSTQIVFEHDPVVLDAVRTAFGMRSGKRLRLRAGDGREGLAELADGSQDVLIRDAFSGALVPAHLRTRGFLREVHRVIGDGVYVANLADTPPMAQARTEAATALQEFRHVALAAEPAQFKGRRYGNVVLVASTRPLPLEALGRRLASGAVRARLLGPGEVRALSSGHRPEDDPAPEAG
jgi:spermidine synthase